AAGGLPRDRRSPASPFSGRSRTRRRPARGGYRGSHPSSRVAIPSRLLLVEGRSAHLPILFLIGGIVLRYRAIASRSALVRSLNPDSVPSMTSPMSPPATSPSGLLPVPR